MRWTSAALFPDFGAASATLRGLKWHLRGVPDQAGYLMVLPAPLGRDGRWRSEEGNILAVAHIARSDFDVIHEQAQRIRATFVKHGGRPIELPQLVVDLVFQDWAMRTLELHTPGGAGEVNLLFMSTLDEVPSEDSTPLQEGVLVVTSHAKCRQCGGTRHKAARLNLCEACWLKVKPAIRAQWRSVKERRKVRRDIDAHVNEQRRLREAAEAEARERAEAAARNAVTTTVTTPEPFRWQDYTPEQAQTEIDRIKEAGVPQRGDPARGPYMLLHKIARGGTIGSGPGRVHKVSDPTAQEVLAARLYIDTDLPVQEIVWAMRMNKSSMQFVRQRTHTKTREDTRPWRPKGHRLEDEELVVQGLDAYWRHKTTGERREIWPVAEAEPELSVATDPPVSEEVQQEAREAFEAAVAEPVAAEPVKRTRKTWPLHEKLEIAQAYDDLSLPMSEIYRAFSVDESSVMRFVHEFGVPIRRMKNRPTGRVLNIDGKWVWKSYAEVPDEVTEPVQQEAPVQPAPPPAPPVANGFQAVVADARPAFMPESEVHERSYAQEVSSLQALAVPPPPQIEHAWYVRFTVRHQGIIAATTFDEVSRKVREQFGQEVDIEMVQKA